MHLSFNGLVMFTSGLSNVFILIWMNMNLVTWNVMVIIYVF